MREKYDVVIVGAGNAALCAALSARESGARVLILEKAPKNKRGGNSFFTDGAIRFAYNDLKGLQKVVDCLNNKKAKQIDLPPYTNEDYYNDMMKVTENESNPTLVNHLVSKSYETILWMKEQGVIFELNENQSFEKNGKINFWGGLPVKTVKKGIGLIDALFIKAEKSGIDIKYESPAIELEKLDNTITGITTKSADGNTISYKAKSVVLACGGFEANKEMRIKYLGKEWERAVVRGSEYNTGDGIQMALKVAAQREGQYTGCHAHTTDYNAPEVGDYSKPGDIYKKSSYPLGLIVNTEGKRFVDEGADFRNYTYAKYGRETLRQPNQKAFQLFDNQVRTMLRKEYELEEATIIKADSIEELAKKMGVDINTFLSTIQKYNQAVQNGEYNPSIKDEKSTKGIVPPKSNWALKFNQAPFYAFPVTCGITFTFGGIRVNEKGEVLGNNHKPIKGLYAAGEMVGGLFYHNYPGGSGLMSGSVFGKTAGAFAARYTGNL